jgi:hypothetical protein
VTYFKISSRQLLVATDEDHKNIRKSVPRTDSLRKDVLLYLKRDFESSDKMADVKKV